MVLIWHRVNHSVKRRRQALHQTYRHYYLNIGVEAAKLSDWRIESNRNFFLPELECSTVQALSVAGKRCGSLPEHQHSPSHRLTALLFRWLFSRNTSFFARHFVWGTVGGGVDDVLHHAIIRDGFVHDLSSSTVVKTVVQDS